MSIFTRTFKTFAMVAAMGCTLSLSAQEPSIAIEVSDLTPTNGSFSITPSDDSFRYVWSFMPTVEFEALGDMFEYSKASVDRVYDAYKNYYPGYTWEEALEDATITSSDYEYEQESMFKWELSTGLIPDTDYTIYAFAFNADITGGDLYKAEFRTPAVPASDLDLKVEVVSMVIDSPDDATDRTVTVTLKVTPSSDDTYVAEWARKAWTADYDLTTDFGVSQYVSAEISYYGHTFNGEQTITYKKQPIDSDYYLFVYGYDDDCAAPNTAVQVIPVHTEEMQAQPQKKAFTIEVSEVTQTGAYIRLIPDESVDKYYWNISLARNIEEIWGGRDVFQEGMDKGWWQYLADFYPDMTWVDVMKLFRSEGPIEGYTKDMPDDVETLKWNEDYVLYAYGIDDEGELTTDIYFFDFKTLPCNESDLEFDFQVVSVEDDPEHSFGSRVCHKVTIDIYPSDSEAQYAFNYHKVAILDQYYDAEVPDLDAYVFDQFMYSAKYATDAARVVMSDIREDQTYYLVVMGWDEAPNTEINTFQFDYRTPAAGADFVEAEAVTVRAIEGGITIEGRYEYAAVTSVDGKLAAGLRGDGASASLLPGVYIVNYTVDGVNHVQKVLVK